MVAINLGTNENRNLVLLRYEFFEGGCCYAALMRPKKVETRLQLQLQLGR